MRLILLLTLLGILHEARASIQCLCTRHVENRLFSCPDNVDWQSSLYGNDYDQRCLPSAENIIPPIGWKAVYSDHKLLYLVDDARLVYETCARQFSSFPNEMSKLFADTKCPPKFRPGFNIHGLIPTTKPTTQSTTPSTTAGTTKPTPTVPTPVTVKQTQQSAKCDIMKVMAHITKKESASHPAADQCSGGANEGYNALIIDSCSPGANAADPITWKKERQVLTNCDQIPVGEPLGYFPFGDTAMPGMAALFWSCDVQANTYQIAYQRCGKVLEIEPVGKHSLFSKDLFYTISFI